MRCAKCGGEVSDDPKFCPHCGAKFVPRQEAVQVEGDPGAYYCWKHKREITRVTCGRCEKPICTKCLVVGPAGVRCRECSRNKVPVRMRGLVHDAASGVGRIDGFRIWYLYLLIAFVAPFIIGLVRSCFR